MSEHRYGCHNKERPTPETFYVGQEGWKTRIFAGVMAQGIERTPKFIRVKHRLTTECQYDKQAVDKDCAGCKHIKKEETNV